MEMLSPAQCGLLVRKGNMLDWHRLTSVEAAVGGCVGLFGRICCASGKTKLMTYVDVCSNSSMGTSIENQDDGQA